MTRELKQQQDDKFLTVLLLPQHSGLTRLNKMEYLKYLHITVISVTDNSIFKFGLE